MYSHYHHHLPTRSACARFPRAMLRGVTLNGTEIGPVDLSGADLAQADHQLTPVDDGARIVDPRPGGGFQRGGFGGQAVGSRRFSGRGEI